MNGAPILLASPRCPTTHGVRMPCMVTAAICPGRMPPLYPSASKVSGQTRVYGDAVSRTKLAAMASGLVFVVLDLADHAVLVLVRRELAVMLFESKPAPG